MSKCIRLAISIVCLLWIFGVSGTLAQTPVEAQSPLVTAACSSEFVRFTAPTKVYEMRLKVFTPTGQTLYDSDFKFGNMLDWRLSDQHGQHLADGSYYCVITTRSLSGQLSHRRGMVLLQDGQPVLQAALSAQDIQPPKSLASIDLADILMLSGKGAGIPLTTLAHDGEQGRLVSGSGGLSFRLGDVFAGKDVEHMRLTPEGKLGIGLENPQAKLDVAGLIRTSEGIVFPDGTVQTTASGAPRAASGEATEEGKPTVPKAPDQTITGTGTTNYISKWTAATTLANSSIYDAGSSVGIGTGNTPGAGISGFVGLDLVGNDSLAVRTRVRNFNSGGYAILNFGNDSVANIGGFFVNGSTNNSYAGPSSLNLINVAGAVSLGTSNTSHLIIDTNGNFGISAPGGSSGVPLAGYRLRVAGGSGTAVYGETSGGATKAGVYGVASGATEPGYGVFGQYSGTGGGYGVYGVSSGANGYGVFGQGTGSGGGVYGILAPGATGYAGYFNGKVGFTGPIEKPAGSFKIDHPLDPANKYLYHSFVESPDMKNIYDGNVTTDANGEAEVVLPDYFDALNRDFRYQLTVIGQFAQAIIGSKIKDNHFTIKTDKPNVEVSWQVTGIRQDAYAEAHRIRVEEEKSEKERGSYLHPEVHGQPEEKGVEWARNPELMRQLKAQREKAQAEKEKKSN